MSEPKLSDIVSGKNMLEGEEATRGGALAGEEALSAHAVAADEPASDPAPSPDPKSKGRDKGKDAAAAKTAKADEGAPPALKTADDDDDSDDAVDPHPVPRKALVQERKKRQELQRKLDELAGRLSVYESKPQQAQQQPQSQTQAQTPAKNPDDEFYELGPAGYLQKQLTAREQALRQETQRAIGQQRIAVSQEMMRSVHEDYDEVEAEFLELSKQNPALQAQCFAHRNPAKFAYDYAKTHRQFQGVGSLDELTAKIRNEERAKIEAELRRDNAKADAARVSTSSAGARSAGAAPVHVGDIPLSEILAG